jgi:hypothetical protein
MAADQEGPVRTSMWSALQRVAVRLEEQPFLRPQFGVGGDIGSQLAVAAKGVCGHGLRLGMLCAC